MARWLKYHRTEDPTVGGGIQLRHIIMTQHNARVLPSYRSSRKTDLGNNLAQLFKNTALVESNVKLHEKGETTTKLSNARSGAFCGMSGILTKCALE